MQQVRAAAAVTVHVAGHLQACVRQPAPCAHGCSLLIHPCTRALGGTGLLQTREGDLRLHSVYVPTNHVYVGDIFLLEDKDIIHTSLSVREGLGEGRGEGWGAAGQHVCVCRQGEPCGTAACGHASIATSWPG
jgi:hypothetical protein